MRLNIYRTTHCRVCALHGQALPTDNVLLNKCVNYFPILFPESLKYTAYLN